ncbi:MAG: GMC family oxidoreductase [Burkholderiaceae bacterium]|nr:GMC family oxidoreductase [Burkholderiaceae bacterium]
MFFDARRVDDGLVQETTICIVGGGAAGITMALEFERHGIDTVLLESGGFKPHAQTMDLYRGENVGIPYEFGDGMRSRLLGGGSNCWGGWCRPLDAEDMHRHDWIPDSGWPFELNELLPYYERAHPLLRLGPLNYDIEHWVSAVNRSDVRRMPLPSGDVLDSVSQFSPPLRFAKAYRKQLRDARHVRLFLHANVVDIETDANGGSVTSVQVKTFSGSRMTVKARHFVLATGGIENARILLASNKGHGAGLGNGNDLVGRYFMDHPRLQLGKVRFRDAWRRNKLYDIMFHYLNPAVAAHGTMVAAQMTVAPEVRRRERLLNGRVWFWSVFPGEGTAAADALIRMKHRLHAKVDPQHSFLGDLLTMAREPFNTLNFIAARQLRPVGILKELHFQMIKEARFQMICEPTPDPNSRVTLASSRDALGMPRARVNWQLGDQVKHTFDRTLSIIAKELQAAQIADIELDPPLLGREWPAALEGTWHHMGTTRMHDSPKLGVVDRNCRIHGVSNMFVAGSSVFPTAGANFPTFTLVALALRLSDHIVTRLRRPDAELRQSVANAVTAGHDKELAVSAAEEGEPAALRARVQPTPAVR